jgi:predicted DsbA family dithiol-disulfide isomerase
MHDRLINSRPALQAAEFAREQGRFREMHQALFRAYWDEARDISEMGVLRNLAEEVGIDPEAIQTAVQSDRYGDYLEARRAEAEELMINGIPAHVIAESYLIMGAQTYEVFERVMARLDVRRRNAVPP